MTDFPRRWDGPHFKPPREAPRAARRQKRMARATLERAEMLKARRRDRVCRFPGCGCGPLGLPTEVAHARHRGMGGNPAGDRTTTAGLILVCSARHQDRRVSVDRGTLRWQPLTDAGADGPVAWEVDLSALGGIGGRPRHARGTWREVARETAIRQWAPATPIQQALLTLLGLMQL